MAVSYTYLQFQNQIAYELGYRSDLLTVPSGFAVSLSPIQQAIQNAIAKWERERFYFNEITSQNNFNTVPGQEFYTSASSSLIGTSPHLDKVWISVSGNRYTLNPRTEQYLTDVSVNLSVTGQPVDYALYAETMRLYPVPGGIYSISFEGTQRFATLSAATDTNVWLQDAADLIKAETKFYILTNIIKNDELADQQKKLIYGDPENPMFEGYYYVLKGETTQRTATAKMRGRYF